MDASSGLDLEEGSLSCCENDNMAQHDATLMQAWMDRPRKGWSLGEVF